MRVRFSRDAFADLEEIFSYVAMDNPAAAVIDCVARPVACLADFPDLGHPTDRADIRVHPFGRYPYLVFYEVTAEAIVVHHVRRGTRRRPWDRE